MQTKSANPRSDVIIQIFMERGDLKKKKKTYFPVYLVQNSPWDTKKVKTKAKCVSAKRVEMCNTNLKSFD